MQMRIEDFMTIFILFHCLTTKMSTTTTTTMFDELSFWARFTVN